jgi:hypothetical protein
VSLNQGYMFFGGHTVIEKPGVPEKFTTSTAAPSNIQMNLGSGSLSAAAVNGTTVNSDTINSNKIHVGNIKIDTGSNRHIVEIPTGGVIKIGNTVIGEKELKILTGQQDIKLSNGQYSGLLDSGGRSGDKDSRPVSIKSGGIAYIQSDSSDSAFKRWRLSPW